MPLCNVVHDALNHHEMQGGICIPVRDWPLKKGFEVLVVPQWLLVVPKWQSLFWVAHLRLFFGNATCHFLAGRGGGLNLGGLFGSCCTERFCSMRFASWCYCVTVLPWCYSCILWCIGPCRCAEERARPLRRRWQLSRKLQQPSRKLLRPCPPCNLRSGHA